MLFFFFGLILLFFHSFDAVSEPQADGGRRNGAQDQRGPRAVPAGGHARLHPLLPHRRNEPGPYLQVLFFKALATKAAQTEKGFHL